MSTHCFIAPHDVLVLRGNRLFGDPGSHGESFLPPWPSVAAGALRTWLLAEAGIDLAGFAAGRVNHEFMGTPDNPGTFTLASFDLARERDGSVESLHRAPADLELVEEGDVLRVRRMRSSRMPGSLLSSSPLQHLPLLASDSRSKPAGGWWMTQSGWQKYLLGALPDAGEWLHSRNLWSIDHRVGVGLEPERRRAADGRLFSLQAICLGDGYGERAAIGRVGFLARIDGARLPRSGTLRFGGDGRAAEVRTVDHLGAVADYEGIASSGRCRLVLTTPGIFSRGWLPEGTSGEGDDLRFSLHGVTGRLVAAAVPRAEVVSGFDIARWRPKAAQRAVPAGAVYWLDQLKGSPESLGKLAEQGLWTDGGQTARRAEGFNRIAIAQD